MISTDEQMVKTLVARYTAALESLEAATSATAIVNARSTLKDVKEQAQALWQAIVEAGATFESIDRLHAAFDAGFLGALSELRDLDLDSLILFPPNTETLEQRGVHT